MNMYPNNSFFHTHKYLYMTKFFAFITTTLLLISCGKSSQLEEYTRDVKKGVIVEIFRKNPCGIHEEVSPKFYAITHESDTVTCTRYSKIGDSVYFIKYSK